MTRFLQKLSRSTERKPLIRFRSEYRRSHFFPFLVVDAALTILVVGGVLLVFSTAHPAEAKNPHSLMTAQGNYLEHAGAKMLNVSGLENHVSLPIHTGSRYWLGPKVGYSYTTQCTTPGQMTVSYYAKGEEITDISTQKLSVTVYESAAWFDEHLRPILADTEATQINSRGDVLNFDAATMMKVKIMLHLSQEIVLINYPSPQSAESMLRDSEQLTKVVSYDALVGHMRAVN